MNSHNIFIKTIVLGILLFSGYCFSQLKMISFEELSILQKEEKRNVVIFVHTDWCNYCKAMQKTTFNDKEIINILNNQYYFISFNAEDKREIKFLGKIFKYKKQGKDRGINELSDFLSDENDKDIFPKILFLNTDNELIYKVNGFIDKKSFRKSIDLILNKK